MPKAVVLLSGGQDSTTCLAWTIKKFGNSKLDSSQNSDKITRKNIETISFDYGQKHKIELDAAKKIAQKLKIKHTIIKTDIFKQLGKNALTHNIKIKVQKNGLPTTFVPGRNIFFLTIAAAYAYAHDIHDIVTGVCQTDYSGYPDCRDSTIKLLEKTLSYGMDYKFKIHTPLMFLTKAKTVKLMKNLGYYDLLGLTRTCYKGKIPPCGSCPACILRTKGFSEANLKDPSVKLAPQAER